ncbi:MAG: extracellular solute-binding protein [Ktedonobacteraceae bacterium]|nr:extracellular solute-binding protein [Ktedonobacteraceae bacterium]
MKRREFLRSVGAAGAALALPLSISACGGSTPGGSQNATINWWHIQTGDPGKATWQNLANQYKKSHPNVKINITILENDAFKSKLATVMQSGNPPDLFQSWGGGVLFQYAKAGLVQDITADLQGQWGDSFNKSALDVYGNDGKYYGVPWDMGAVGIWYNKKLFAKAKIEQPPTTWAEFLQVVQKLKSAGITPIALGEKEKWPGHFWWVYLAVRLGGKDAFTKAYTRTGSFADPPFVEAGKHLQELVALDPFSKGYLGLAYTDHSAQMGDSKAAMELMGQWAPSADAGAAADQKGPELGFFPFPTVEGGAGNPNDVMGGGNGFAIGKNAPPETVDFLKFLTNAQNQQNMTKDGIVLPTVKTAQSFVTNPNLKSVAQMVSQAAYFQLYYDQYLPPSVAQAVLDSTQGIFAKTLSPDAAAKAIDDSAASALR